MKLPKILSIFIGLAFLVSGAAYGAVIKVPDDYPTIQEAMDVAVNGDIVEVASGTFKGTGNRDLDFKGKEITVQSINGPNDTIIDCEELGRGFYFHSGETDKSVLSGFTVTNGLSAGRGGGIYCDSADPRIVDCRVIGNTAREGGGISSYNCTLRIENTIIKDNNCTYRGGGGGIDFHNGSLIMNNSFVICNSAPYNDGGGIYLQYSSCEIFNSVIADNSSEETGGGFCFEYGSDYQIINSTIVGNQSPKAIGAAISVLNDAHVTLTNCIVSDNVGNTGLDEKYCQGTSSITLNYCNTFNNSPAGCVNITRNNCLGIPPTEGVDPLFVDPTNYDFHLTSSSPCIDTGTSEGAPNVDFEGDVRPWGAEFDMGADEFVPSYIEVDIDIKPGSYPNSINLKSRGVVPVAILTTDDFDADYVDPDTVFFTGAIPLRWNIEDVDRDGDDDMILHFMTRKLDLTKDSTEATLEGETIEGTPIVGTDSVNIVPKGKMLRKKTKKKKKKETSR